MKLEIPAGDFHAYLFDCDGTIVDSMPLHYNAWKQALAEWNCVYPEDLFYAWGGKPVRKIIADLNAMHGLDMPVDVLAHRKEAFYLAQLPELKAIPRFSSTCSPSTDEFLSPLSRAVGAPPSLGR